MTDLARDLKSSEAGTDSAVAIVAPRTSTTEKVLRIVVPVGMLVLAVVAWHLDRGAPTTSRNTSCRRRPMSPIRCSTTGRRCCRRSG